MMSNNFISPFSCQCAPNGSVKPPERSDSGVRVRFNSWLGVLFLISLSTLLKSDREMAKANTSCDFTPFSLKLGFCASLFCQFILKCLLLQCHELTVSLRIHKGVCRVAFL